MAVKKVATATRYRFDGHGFKHGEGKYFILFISGQIESEVYPASCTRENGCFFGGKRR